MSDAAFLDTGVVFGYCVPLDQHHVRCSEYVEDTDRTVYTTSTVDSEFQRMKRDRVQELATAVLDHVRALLRADFEGTLGPMDVDDIQRRILARDDDAYQYLYWYYDDLEPFVARREVVEDLREFARDVESVALQRKEDLDSTVEEWVCRDSHRELRSDLSMIHDEDRRICVEAHDLACHVDGRTEFATVNPRDFLDDGREERILEATEIDAIRDLAIRS